MRRTNEVIVTRMGLKYSPPSLSVEYRNGKNRRDHSHIPMKRYLDRYASGYPYMSPAERSMAVRATVDILVDKHDELLHQVPLKTLRRLIEKLYARHSQNGSVAGTRAGDEYREEQSTVHSYGDATRDRTLDHNVDHYLGYSALDSVGDGIMTDNSSIEDNLRGAMYVHQARSSPVSTCSSTYSHGKKKRTIIEETKRLDEEVKELREALRLAKQWEQFDKRQYITSEGNSPKKDRLASASKLVVEYPAPFKHDRTSAMAADEERRETKPDKSVLGRKENPKDDSSTTSKLLLLRVAKSKAEQFELMSEGKRIKMQLALEKKAEKKARREASIAMKKEKKERQRETKAKAKEIKLACLQQRANAEDALRNKAKREAAKREDLRLALEFAQKQKAHNTKEKELQSHVTPKLKKTKRYGMTGHKKRWLADSPVLLLEDDENVELTDDKPNTRALAKEIVELKEKLSQLQCEEEQRKETDGVGNFLCAAVQCLPLCNNASSADGDNNPSSLHDRKVTKVQNSRRPKQLRQKQNRTTPKKTGLCFV